MLGDFTFMFSGFVVVFIILNSYFQTYGDMTNITHKSGRTYLVRNVEYTEPNKSKEEAVNKLDAIVEKITKLIDHMNTEYKDHPFVKRINSNINLDNINESVPDSEYTSYSFNKGEKIVFCIRNKKTHEFIDDNTVMFVAIHELAHVGTKSIGHTKEFWENMSILLCESKKIGIHTLNDFKNPEPYCGTEITSTPLKCESTSCDKHCKEITTKFRKQLV